VIRRSSAIAFSLIVVCAVALRADISGFVLDSTTSTGIAGARVHVRADLSTSVFTQADGSFTLAVDPLVPIEIAASVPYNRAAAINYLIAGNFASNGDTGVNIFLDRLPTAEDPDYVPASAAKNCGTCHTPVYPQWAGSNHAGTARNAWVMDLYSGNGTAGGNNGYVFRDTHAAGETGFCSACHAPMAEVRDPGNVYLDEVSEKGALEGVNCVTCHQLDSVDGSPAHLNDLHLLGKATYRFPAGQGSPDQFVWGPLSDVTFKGMRASHSPLHKESLLCASCHQYNRPGNGVAGQHTYTEWLASSYAVPGPSYRTCQDCHMPPATDGIGRLCIFLDSDRPGDQRRQHTFIGSTPEMLQNNISLLASASEVGPGRIRVSADVENFGAGHSFPTGVAIRNALLVVTATWNGQELPQAAGPTIPFWGSDDVPGDQPGDYAGHAGKGFAKVLEGRIDGAGPTVRPVLFIDAENVFSDTEIPSGATDNTTVEFQLPPEAPAGAVVDVEAKLLYRRAFRALQVTKGWTQSAHGGPIEIEVARRTLQVKSQGGAATDVPAAGTAGLLALAITLAAAGAWLVARRR
jgi:mono/diheme cytochrome c family protein